MIHRLFVVFLFFILSGFTSSSFIRAEFYEIYRIGDKELIEQYIDKIENNQDLTAYTGALYLKLSGLQKGGSKKLNSFKKGKLLLDSAIEKEPNNTEWRFLRLVIQENVPPILKYSHQIEEDKAIIVHGFPSCDIQLQKIIKEYTKKSKVLKASDL